MKKRNHSAFRILHSAILICLLSVVSVVSVRTSSATDYVNPWAPLRVNSTALEASHILKATPGTLVSVIGYNSSASAQFIQLFDTTTLPADGTAPVAVFKVPAGANFSLDVPITGLPFLTGIVICNSSTAATKTLGSADCFFTAVTK